MYYALYVSLRYFTDYTCCVLCLCACARVFILCIFTLFNLLYIVFFELYYECCLCVLRIVYSVSVYCVLQSGIFISRTHCHIHAINTITYRMLYSAYRSLCIVYYPLCIAVHTPINSPPSLATTIIISINRRWAKYSNKPLLTSLWEQINVGLSKILPRCLSPILSRQMTMILIVFQLFLVIKHWSDVYLELI